MSNNVIINNNLIQDVCPLCSGNQIYPIGKIPCPNDLMYSSTAIRLMRRPELWRCRSCRSGFIQQAVNDQDAEKLYRTSDSSKRWVSSALFEERKTENLVAVMRNAFQSGKTVLDLGCNAGDLLDFAKKHGCATYGMEFSAAAAALCSQKGHTIITGFDSVNFRFDVITAFDLIEHVYDVNDFLCIGTC